MSAIELLAKICDICAEIFEYKIVFIRLIELHSSNASHVMNLGCYWFDRKIIRDLVVKFERW